MEIRIANKDDIQKIFDLRFEVFVNEQNVDPEIELDGEDAYATHFIAEENGIAVGCGRVITEGEDAHIGRLAVKKDYRGNGRGYRICKFIVDYCMDKGLSYIWLNAQLQAVGFYEKLGFKPVGEVFTEADIEHIKMEIK